jgi:methylenetetrahydrofolate reductase (NADPH)
VHISEAYRRKRPVFSFEFFPPQTEAGARALMETARDLRALGPDFVSVTYPLARARRHLTLELVPRIQRELGIVAMAHLTCVDASREELRAILRQLESDGIENVLALGGDAPDGPVVVPREQWFPHASDLIAFIRSEFAFCVGGAAHAEKHPRAADLETDVRMLRVKVDAGASFLITNFFFDNRDYFRLVELARGAGVGVPIVPGIMPVTSVPGIKRMAALNGSHIPAELLGELEPAEADPKAVEAIGIRWAERQCRELLERGAPGIHFYTLNRSTATRQVLSTLRRG